MAFIRSDREPSSPTSFAPIRWRPLAEWAGGKPSPASQATRTENAAASADENSQKIAAVHPSVLNHFNQERHLRSRENFKPNRSALTEWRELSAA
jgi:hypothetical protein